MTLRVIAVVLCISSAFAEDGLELGLPSPGDVIHHTGFSLCYNEQHEQAAWVAYTLTDDEVNARKATRDKLRWDDDPLVATGSATFNDYRKSGYDKGHLAPAADMRWSKNAMRETFLLSNASPQEHEFNAGIWEEIENAVRNFAVQHHAVYVVTGPVLTERLPTIGKDKISVPEYFYKAVLYLNADICQAIGFVIRAEASDLPVERFAVPLDSVEAMTGLDFFNALPDEMEDQAERKMDVKWWLPRHGKLPRK